MSQIPNIKFKTEYCRSWEEGKVCEKGNACFFAHGQQDLRTIQQVQKLSSLGYSQPLSSLFFPYLESRRNRQTKHPHLLSSIQTAQLQDYLLQILRQWFSTKYSGNCKLGDKCTYAHQRREKRKKRPSQEYNQVGQLDTVQTWENYQLYQYYAQAYMNQFMPQQYFFEGQSENYAQEGQEEGLQKMKANYCINQPINGSNNIKEEITFNQPNVSVEQKQVSQDLVSSKQQLNEQI